MHLLARLGTDSILFQLEHCSICRHSHLGIPQIFTHTRHCALGTQPLWGPVQGAPLSGIWVGLRRQPASQAEDRLQEAVTVGCLPKQVRGRVSEIKARKAYLPYYPSRAVDDTSIHPVPQGRNGGVDCDPSPLQNNSPPIAGPSTSLKYILELLSYLYLLLP